MSEACVGKGGWLMEIFYECKAAGTEYTARSTVNSGEDEHESYLLIWLHGNNGRDIGTEF